MENIQTLFPFFSMFVWFSGNEFVWVEFPNIGTTDIFGQIALCCGELSCALQDVQQYLWFLPTKYQHPPSIPLVVTIKCVSKHCHLHPDKNTCPGVGGKSSVENHWIRLYLSLEGKGHFLYWVPGMYIVLSFLTVFSSYVVIFVSVSQMKKLKLRLNLEKASCKLYNSTSSSDCLFLPLIPPSHLSPALRKYTLTVSQWCLGLCNEDGH